MLHRQQQKWRWVFKQRHLEMSDQCNCDYPSSDMFSRWNLLLEQTTTQRKLCSTIFTALLFPTICPDSVATPGKLVQAAIHITPRWHCSLFGWWTGIGTLPLHNPACWQSVAFSCMCSSSCCGIRPQRLLWGVYGQRNPGGLVIFPWRTSQMVEYLRQTLLSLAFNHRLN